MQPVADAVKLRRVDGVGAILLLVAVFLMWDRRPPVFTAKAAERLADLTV